MPLDRKATSSRLGLLTLPNRMKQVGCQRHMREKRARRARFPLTRGIY
jgi:hypothetical protein